MPDFQDFGEWKIMINCQQHPTVSVPKFLKRNLIPQLGMKNYFIFEQLKEKRHLSQSWTPDYKKQKQFCNKYPCLSFEV